MQYFFTFAKFKVTIFVFQISDYHLAPEKKAWVINGPTRGTSLKPFSWSQYPNATHEGLPDTYNFDFVFMTPTLQP